MRTESTFGRGQVLHASTEPAPLAPEWADQAVERFITSSQLWRAAGGLLGLISLLVGVVLLFGGGYTSIQGLRIPIAFVLSWFGRSIETGNIPPLPWWILPAGTTFIQIFARRVPELRPLWWPSIIYDTTTTAVYVTIGAILTALSLKHGAPWEIVIVFATLSTGVAMLTTIWAEKFFLGGIRIIYGVIVGK